MARYLIQRMEDEEGEVTLESLLLYSDEGTAEEVHLCHLDCSTSISKAITHIVPITFLENQLLVAVPAGAWHRQIARRFLPRTALSRPVSVEVPATTAEGDVTTLKVWVGLLEKELVAQLRLEMSGDEEALDFADSLGHAALPTPDSLVRVANEQFSFYSAESHADAPLEKKEGGPVEDRLLALESQFSLIRQQLEDLPNKLGQKREGSRSPPARLAGIPEDQLARLASLMTKSPPKI